MEFARINDHGKSKKNNKQGSTSEIDRIEEALNLLSSIPDDLEDQEG